MQRRGWQRAGAVAGLAMAAGFAPVVAAEPLPADVCEQLKSERQVLIEAGVPDVVKNGPTWAKANAGPDKVKAARRYIELQEQLLFRCGLAKLKVLAPGGGDEGGESAEAPPAAAAAAHAAEAPKAAAKKPVAKPAAKAAVDSAAEAEPKPKAAAKPHPKPKPKAKVDDAYRPEAAGGNEGGAVKP